MDSSIAIMYQVPVGKIVTRGNLKVRLSSAYNRKMLPKYQYEESIAAVWQARCKANPKLWNGTKFRLHEAYAENNCTVFELGITCYRDFIGSNWSPNARIYQELGRQNWENSQIYLSDALGVGALVETADGHFILLRRSRHCGEAVGLMDIPGGHPEPQVRSSMIYHSCTDRAALLAVTPQSPKHRLLNFLLQFLFHLPGTGRQNRGLQHKLGSFVAQ